MGLFNRIGSAWSALKSPKASGAVNVAGMTQEELYRWLRQGSETASGAFVTESSAMRVATAWRCVNIISGAVATLPRDVVRRVGETRREPAVGHPVRRIFTVKPNHWQTPLEFIRMMQAHLLLRGNAYARKVMLGREVVALLPLHPDRVDPEQAADGSMIYRVALADGRRIVLTQSEVFHLRGLTLDGKAGLSVISHARESLGLSLQTEAAGARLFRQGVLAGGALKTAGRLSEDGRKNITDMLASRYAGSENAGKIMVLEEGLEPVQVALTAVDAQFLETRDFQRIDVAQFFGVPPHMLGLTDKATSWGAGIEQQGIGFVTYTLGEWIATWEAAIKRDLFSPAEAETLDFKFFTAGLLRGDVKTRWAAYVQALQYGVMSVDEVRALEDMNPRADGKGGEYYPPPNMTGKAAQLPAEEGKTE